MCGESRECVECGATFVPQERYEVRCEKCEWEPKPAQLRDGESTDEMGHAARNAEQLRIAREEIEEVGCDG